MHRSFKIILVHARVTRACNADRVWLEMEVHDTIWTCDPIGTVPTIQRIRDVFLGGLPLVLIDLTEIRYRVACVESDALSCHFGPSVVQTIRNRA